MPSAHFISPMEYMKKMAEQNRYYQFNTNFYISNKVVDIIEFTEGVETLTIETPYSGTVEIGQLFDEEETLQKITKNLNSALFPQKQELTQSQLLTSIELTKNQESLPQSGVTPEQSLLEE